MQEPTDAEAIALAIAGDQDAFAVLVRRYVWAARAVAHAIVRSEADADDAVQDGLLLAYQKLHTARCPDRFRAWLLRIVRNRAYNMREWQRVRSHPGLRAGGTVPSADDPACGAERSQARGAILAALGRIKPVQAKAVWLHDVEGFTHREIAALLRTSEAMSRKHLMQARACLRRELAHFRDHT